MLLAIYISWILCSYRYFDVIVLFLCSERYIWNYHFFRVYFNRIIIVSVSNCVVVWYFNSMFGWLLIINDNIFTNQKYTESIVGYTRTVFDIFLYYWFADSYECYDIIYSRYATNWVVDVCSIFFWRVIVNSSFIGNFFFQRCYCRFWCEYFI